MRTLSLCVYLILLLPILSGAADYALLVSQVEVLENKYAAKEMDRDAVLRTLRARLQELPVKDANVALLLRDLSNAQKKAELNLTPFRNRLQTLAFLQRHTLRVETVDAQRMNQILRKREFIVEEETGLWDIIVAKILNWIQSLLDWMPVGDQLIFVSRLIMTIALAGLTALLLYLIVKYTRRTPPATQLSPVIVSRQTLLQKPSYYARLAEQALNDHDFRLACRHYFYAILSSLHYAGQISYQPSRTNWEYWRSLRNKTENQVEARHFEESVRAYEKFWYGNQDVDSLAAGSFRKTTQFFLEKFV
ncbi:MAG TPA: DUF4129 domain-containing protein [Acidobacteriota bacterium]|nr:DUF4129 domain-containing protein [Acidobacteriota bacterium]